ncbi:MAG: response regulator [Acidobacteriota bacterium]
MDELESGESPTADVKTSGGLDRSADDPGGWFQTMAATVSDQMAYIDRHGIFRAVNQAYLDATSQRNGRELGHDEVVGRAIEDVLPEGLVSEVVRPNLARCLAGHPVSLQRWFDIGGESKYLHVHYHPHRVAADSDVVGAVVVLRDHTVLRHCQLRLRELASSVAVMEGEIEKVATRLVEIAVEGMRIPSASVWRLDLAQPALQIIVSHDERDLPPLKVLPLGDLPRLVQALADGHVVDAHEAMVDPRTRELGDLWLRPRRTLSVLAAPVMVGGHLVGVLWLEAGPNLHIWQAQEAAFAAEASALLAHVFLHLERRQLEMRLVEGQKREGLGVLAGGLAHDFNNLLVGILGGADLLHRHLHDQPQPLQRLELIQAAARRASELCSQMLAYAGKGRLETRRADLSQLVDGTVKLLRSTLDDNVELYLKLQDALPPIEADVTQVRQVVMNLVMNAAEALQGVPGEVNVRTGVVELGPGDFSPTSSAGRDDLIVVEAPAPGKYVSLRVQDTGCGMAHDTVERIFDPFFSTKFTGRGLGMAAVLGIVRGHRGGIRIETRIGHGTWIEIVLPARDLPMEEETLAAAEAPAESSVPAAGDTVSEDRRRRALVVDDEEIVRIIASEMMEILGFDVTVAEDGPRALRLLEAAPDSFDIVLLDVTMPEMSGVEVLIRLRKLRADLPVLIASGFSAEDLTRRFAEHPIQGIIHKPYRFEELSQLVRSVLA